MKSAVLIRLNGLCGVQSMQLFEYFAVISSQAKQRDGSDNIDTCCDTFRWYRRRTWM